MSQASTGAVIRYWLRPQRDRLHLYRIEVEHALYLAAATQEQIKDVLADMLRQQTESLAGISYSLVDLSDEIAAGFSALRKDLGAVNDTLYHGFYRLHVDLLGANERLDDLLLLTYDKESYQGRLDARLSAARARSALHKASGEYSDAMTRTRQALNESNLAKADAMLDEAVVLFHRAASHPDFALDAHFQIGYLAQQHQRNIEAAYEHYNKALGPGHSSHFVRTSRHLAHLDYLSGQASRALDRMQELIAHDGAITAFAHDLQMAYDQPWEGKSCIRALEAALEAHGPLLAGCGLLGNVRRQFEDGRSFSATEGFRNSHALIMKELQALRPEVCVYFDAARYANAAGDSAQALSWIKHCYRAQFTLKSRRAFLFEAMADKDLLQGDVETFLRAAWAAVEREKGVEEAAVREHLRAQAAAARAADLAAASAAASAAAEAQRLRRNAASKHNALTGAATGAVVMGFSGCVSCITSSPTQDFPYLPSFNLFSGLMLGAILGAVIGFLIGQTKD